MSDDKFTHLFPEWQLLQALKQALRDPVQGEIKQDDIRFWDLPVVRTPASWEAKKLSTLFQRPSLPKYLFDSGFPKDGVNKYGFKDWEEYKNYWNLRPDFQIVAIEAGHWSFMVLFDAKGGHIANNQSTWAEPKERRYYDFLQNAQKPQAKGFIYIVPSNAGDKCRQCLEDKFSGVDTVTVGMIYWEALLPIIGDQLLGFAIDEVVKNMRGIQQLRAWQVARPSLQKS